MHKGYLRTAFIVGAITVALGAFGAHKLKEMLDEDALKVYEKAILYQFIHVFALAMSAILYKYFPNGRVKASAVLFLLGIVLFSGSLYLLSFGAATDAAGFKWAGPITPIGGVCFIAGWITLALGIQKSDRHADKDR